MNPSTVDLCALRPTAFICGQGDLWENARAGRLDCIRILASVLKDRGFDVRYTPLTGNVETQAHVDRRHLFVMLDDQPVDAPNVVYCIPSYLRGFWYFDPVGTRNNSSIASRSFRPQGMSAAFARTFADTLRDTFVAENVSKFDQDKVPGFTPKPGAICVFAQDFKSPRYHDHYMTYPDLIRAVISQRGTRHVYIKPHPRQSLSEAMTLMSFHAPGAGVEVTTHSIHGLLAQASVAVSLSSAVLLEAQLHHVPGIVAGQVDFHHNMVTLRDPADFSIARDQALTDQFQYDKFLVFFFAHGMVQPQLHQKTRDRMDAVLNEIDASNA